jgi:two-component system NtrC family response regulator
MKDTARQPVILLVEDDMPQRRTLAGFLAKRGYAVLEAGSASEAHTVAGSRDFDLLITDLRLGGPDGVTLLGEFRTSNPDIEALVLTAYGTVEDAVRAMRAGAYDFLAKPVDLDRLEALIEKVLEKSGLVRENRELREVLGTSGPFASIIGESDAIRKVNELAAKIAPSRAPVLVLGESGTGKEVLARAIHLASNRKARPFITLNCAALSESLIESELFGHEKGAFTGADRLKKGRFELAEGGTLFLDEIGDIPLPLQVKLLNVLQSSKFERVGGVETLKADVRIISATHRDLDAAIAEGRFRADLFYRLNVVSITLPPLRERRQDIPLLADHFIKKHSDLGGVAIRGISPEAIELLKNNPFPGNIRELENWIERAVVLAGGDRLTADDFPVQFPQAQPDGGGGPLQPGSLEESVAELEVRLIRAALARNAGNQSAAARELGISERMIRYKIRKYGL